MVTETALEQHALALVEWLRDRRYGSVRVIDVVATVITDVQDDLAIQLDVTLNDPAGDTWPVDDLLDLRRDVWARVRALPDGFVAYVVPRPETLEDQEPEPADDVDGG